MIYCVHFDSVGPALFNSIPPEIKLAKTIASFKSKLDRFLKSIPDNPPLPNYVCLNNNSIREWTAGGGGTPYLVHWDEDETTDTSPQVGPIQELAAF